MYYPDFFRIYCEDEVNKHGPSSASSCTKRQHRLALVELKAMDTWMAIKGTQCSVFSL